MIQGQVISSVMSAALLLAVCQGCATDNPYPPGLTDEEGDGIGFEPAPLSDMASDGVTTTLNIPDFKVTATYPGQYGVVTIMDDVVVRRTGPDSWTYSPTIQWPGPPVNFYMVNPVQTKWSVRKWDTGADLWSYQNDGKSDLIVAADYNAVESPGPVKVNFRHALSYVAAAIRTDIPQEYEVRIKFAYFSRLDGSGHYIWPTASTNQQNPQEIGSAAASGVWHESWPVDYDDFRFTVFGNNEPGWDGTPIPSGLDSYFPLDGTGVQFMIPHKIRESVAEEWGSWNGDNINVVYRIVRKADGVVIWPDSSTKQENVAQSVEPSGTWALAPYPLRSVTEEWLPGLAYIYRLTLHMPQELCGVGSTRSASGRQFPMEVDVAPY